MISVKETKRVLKQAIDMGNYVDSLEIAVITAKVRSKKTTSKIRELADKVQELSIDLHNAITALKIEAEDVIVSLEVDAAMDKETKK